MAMRSPYKFLDSYGFRDHDLFFGRDREIKILFADVVVQPLVVLFAKTGTGKTSLINAGVRPLLDEQGYESFHVRVQRDPMQSALSVIEEQLGRPLPPSGGFAARLNALGLQLGKPLVLFFDQFEEFFLYAVQDDYGRARRFVSELARIYEDDESLAHVVLSMREEFFVELDMFSDEIPNIFDEGSNLRLRWFDREAAIDAIERPARAFGVTFEPELLEALVRDLTESGRVVLRTNPTKQIEPAQLQIVCHTLWQRRSENQITLEQYRALGAAEQGGSVAQQIIEQRLYEGFEQLETREQLHVLVKLLPRLRTDRGTKRIWDLLSLRQALDADESTLRALLKRLAQAHLIQLSTREGPDVVELTHDYLVERLDELTRAARQVWLRRILRETLGQGDQPLLDMKNVLEVRDQLHLLELTRAEGELVLRSALERGVKLDQIIGPVIDSGVDVWQVLRQRLSASDDDKETSHLLVALLELEMPEAFSLLEWALKNDRQAASRLWGLAKQSTPEAFWILNTALEEGWLRDHGISTLPLAESEGAVAFLETARLREEFANEALLALSALTRSSNSLVAEAAKRALDDPLPEPIEVQRKKPQLGDHYRLVAGEIRAGRVVPFLGADANLCGRPEELTWRPGQFDWLPTNTELAQYLARMFSYRGKCEDDLMRVAQYVTLTVGAFPLYEELRRLFNGDYPPTALHRFLAELPSILREHRAEAPPYQLIVTTNYDDVLEQAFRDADEPFDLVIYDAEGPDRGKFTHHPHDGTPRTILEPNAYYDLTTDERTVILKLGGSVDRDDETRDSFVITEDHYIDYLARTDVSKLFPVTLVRTLRRSHCLFVGYSLQESNQRVILNRLWGDEKLRSKSWAIQRNPDPVDEGLWSRRDVQSLDVPLEDYIDGLREALRAEKPSGR